MKQIFVFLFVCITLINYTGATTNKPCFWIFKWRFPPRIPPTPPIPITTTTPAQITTTSPIITTTTQSIENPASGDGNPTTSTEGIDARNAVDDEGAGQLDGVQDENNNVSSS